MLPRIGASRTACERTSVNRSRTQSILESQRAAALHWEHSLQVTCASIRMEKSAGTPTTRDRVRKPATSSWYVGEREYCGPWSCKPPPYARPR